MTTWQEASETNKKYGGGDSLFVSLRNAGDEFIGVIVGEPFVELVAFKKGQKAVRDQKLIARNLVDDPTWVKKPETKFNFFSDGKMRILTIDNFQFATIEKIGDQNAIEESKLRFYAKDGKTKKDDGSYWPQFFVELVGHVSQGERLELQTTPKHDLAAIARGEKPKLHTANKQRSMIEVEEEVLPF